MEKLSEKLNKDANHERRTDDSNYTTAYVAGIRYAARLAVDYEAETEKRIAELEAKLQELGSQQNAILQRSRDIQSQLAWTPVSDGLPTEPGWYVFHGKEEGTDLVYGADTGPHSLWCGSTETYDNKDVSTFDVYRRITLPERET